jgi:hypothetical protein
MDQNLLQKGGPHIVSGEMSISPEKKVASVKPGGGRNQDQASRDALPGFEWLTSHTTATSKDVNGQGVYPKASKSTKESSNG